jgi:hypothetical protein
LDEADGRAHEIKFRADLIFKEAFITEVRIFLVGEHQECRRSNLRLRHVIDAQRARFRRGAALRIDLHFAGSRGVLL